MAEAAGLIYEEHGGGNPDPPLVLLHGAGGSRLNWPPLLRRLPGRRTLAPDLPGHGRSLPRDEATIGDYAEEVADWLDAVGVPPAVLVGHSMGSAVALSLALASADRVRGLVLIGAGPRLRVNARLLEATSRPDTFPDAVEKIIAWSFAAQASARLVELARRRMLEVDAESAHRALTSCNAFDAGDRLAEIACPTLILVGDSDRMTPPALSDELAEKIPGARLEVIPGAGHMLMMERPRDVADRLQAFCRTEFPEAGGRPAVT